MHVDGKVSILIRFLHFILFPYSSFG